jgi:molybdopterin-containing oxidoreductase family membrane subunit
VKAVYALYPDADAAHRAVQSLRAAGVADPDITVISGEPIEGHELGRRDAGTWMWWIASAGGLTGLAFGTWITWMTETAWPLPTGNMPIVAWWPNLIVMFELTMLGGILAAVVTLLVTAGLPSFASKLYDPEVTNGKILVGVANPAPSSRPAIERALVAGGAQVKSLGTAL